MNSEASDAGSGRHDDLQEAIASMRRQLGRLTVSASVTTLALFLNVSVVFGYVANYFGRDAMMRGAPFYLLGIAALFGVVIGLLALRKNRSGWLWGLFGALAFPIAGIALVCVAFRCPKCRRALTRKERTDRQCPHCGSLSPSGEDLVQAFQSVKRHVVRLTAVVSLMTVAVFVTATAVFGNLVSYFNGDVLLWGGSTAGAAVAGFFFGWFARRKI